MSPKISSTACRNDAPVAFGPIFTYAKSLFQSINYWWDWNCPGRVRTSTVPLKRVSNSWLALILSPWTLNTNRALDNAGHWIPIPHILIECLDLNVVILAHLQMFLRSWKFLWSIMDRFDFPSSLRLTIMAWSSVLYLKVTTDSHLLKMYIVLKLSMLFVFNFPVPSVYVTKLYWCNCSIVSSTYQF